MDEIIIRTISIGLERLAVCSAAIVAIVCGYKLFALTSKHQSAAMVSSAAFRLRFSDIGPGVFFSAFGALILLYLVFRQPVVTAKSGGVIREVAGLMGDSTTTFADYETLVQCATLVAAQPQTPAVKALFDRISSAKGNLIAAGIGAEFARWYGSLATKSPAERDKAIASAADPRWRELAKQLDGLNNGDFRLAP